MQMSNPLKVTLNDAVSINQKMTFLTRVLHHSEDMSEIQDTDCLKAISEFLSDMVIDME